MESTIASASRMRTPRFDAPAADGTADEAAHRPERMPAREVALLSSGADAAAAEVAVNKSVPRGKTSYQLINDPDSLLWYRLWLNRRGAEIVILALFALMHAAFLAVAAIELRDAISDLAVFIPIDVVQFVILAPLFYWSFKYRHPAHSAPAASAHHLQLAQPVPWPFRHHVHAVLIGVSTFLAAMRLSLMDIVLCHVPSVLARGSYVPCVAYQAGAYPFIAMGVCMVVMISYAALLATRWTVAYIVISFSFVAAYAMWITNNFVITGPRPQALDTVVVSVISLVCTAVSIYVSYLSLLEWARSRQQLQSARRVHAVRENVLGLRARVRERMKVAREQGYERAIAYAAHELRNPLHAIAAVLDLDIPTLMGAYEAEASTPKADSLKSIIADLELARSRVAAMHRVIGDITDFPRLREGAAVVVQTQTTLRDILRHVASSCTAVLGEHGWRGGVVDGSLQDTVVTDGVRLEQVLVDCIRHAAAHGCTGIETAFVLVDPSQHPADGGPTVYADSVALSIRAPVESPTRFSNHTPVLADSARTVTDATSCSASPDSDICHEAPPACSDGCLPNVVQPLERPYVAMVVRALSLTVDVLDDTLYDPVHIDASQLDMFTPGVGSPLDSDSTLGRHSARARQQEQGPLDHAHSPDMPIRAIVHASSLSTAVAKLIALRLGGDLGIVNWASSPGQQDAWYITVLPFKQIRSRRHPSGTTRIGCFDRCVRCDRLRFTPAATMRAASIFGPAGRLRKGCENAVYGAVISRALPLVDSNQRNIDAAATEIAASAPTGRAASGTHHARVGSGEMVPVERLRLRLLYADDDAANRRLLSRMIRRLGGEVVLVDDGDQVAAELARAGMLTEADVARLAHVGLRFDPTEVRNALVSAARLGSGAQAFDAILLDIVMIRTDGAEVCRSLRSVLAPSFPIIAATGNANDPERLNAAGFSAILEKPFSMHRLRDVLQQAVATGSRDWGRGAQHSESAGTGMRPLALPSASAPTPASRLS